MGFVVELCIGVLDYNLRFPAFQDCGRCFSSAMFPRWSGFPRFQPNSYSFGAGTFRYYNKRAAVPYPGILAGSISGLKES